MSTDDSTYETLRYEVADRVLTLWLHRPDSLNAFTVTMANELVDAFDRASADDDVAAIVVTGSGRIDGRLMNNPEMLLLDEPSLGLAPLIVKDILSVLVRINQEEKTTILLTEQNIFHALKISQRGYLLENGKIAMQGASQQLLGNEHIKRNYLGV